MTIAQILAAAKKAREGMKAIMDTAGARAEGEQALTEAEAASFDKLKAEHDGYVADAERLQGMEAAEAWAGQSRGSVARTAPVRAGGDPAKKEFENFGQFLAAVRFAPNDSRLNYVERDEGAIASEFHDDGNRAEMRMDTGASGGFMVPTEFRNTLLKVNQETSIVRGGGAQVLDPGDSPDAAVTMPALDQSSSNTNNMFAGVQVSWIGEGGQKPETDAKLREVTLTPHEVAGFITVTDKLLRNWRGASAVLETLLRGAISQAEDYAFIRGSGVAQPEGFINSAAAYKVNRAVSNQVSYADLVAMVAHARLMGNPSLVWVASQSVLPQIAMLADGDGRLIWHPDAKVGFAGSLLGYPLRWNNRGPGLGSKGDISLCDFSMYLIKDGSGPFVAASEHVKFTENKTVIKAFWNVDGATWLTEPVHEENGYQTSPFVVLDVPA